MIQLTILFAKSLLYIPAPIQYKGGALFALYKSNGIHVHMEMYLSILLADVIGNVSARAHKIANLGALAADLSGEHSWQCGGVHGLGLNFKSWPFGC